MIVFPQYSKAVCRSGSDAKTMSGNNVVCYLNHGLDGDLQEMFGCFEFWKVGTELFGAEVFDDL